MLWTPWFVSLKCKAGIRISGLTRFGLPRFDCINKYAVSAGINKASLIRAIGQVYPVSPMHGCLFHLSKNDFKHVHEFGLQQMYLQDDEVFQENIRMLPALSFVPVRLPPLIVCLYIVVMLNSQF